MNATIEWGVSPESWQAFVARCPRATFFHTPGWYLAQAELRGYGINTALIRFDSGAEALIPIATRRRFKGMLTEAQSGIEAAYGGLTSPTPLTSAEVADAYRLVRQRYANLVVTGNPHEAYANVPPGVPGTEDTTQVVTLLPREAQRTAMSEARAKSLRRAAKEGFALEVVQGLTEADVDRFFAVYSEHSEGWSYTKWKQDEAYFHSLLRHAGRDLVLFLVTHDGKLAGFRLLCCVGPVVVALHLARARAYEKTNIGPFMVAESMAWCFENGYEKVDFLPSGQLDGVRAYKASFGGEKLPYSVVSQTGWMGASLESLWRIARRPAVASAS